MTFPQISYFCQNYRNIKASALFKEYVWLVGTISRAGRITLREINERWLRTEMSEGIPFMPPELRDAHNANDRAVMAAYGFDPELPEHEIVAELFRLYRELTE